MPERVKFFYLYHLEDETNQVAQVCTTGRCSTEFLKFGSARSIETYYDPTPCNIRPKTHPSSIWTRQSNKFPHSNIHLNNPSI